MKETKDNSKLRKRWTRHKRELQQDNREVWIDERLDGLKVLIAVESITQEVGEDISKAQRCFNLSENLHCPNHGA
jgi:hypothetical protein